jgi:hypothetical protein
MKEEEKGKKEKFSTCSEINIEEGEGECRVNRDILIFIYVQNL